MFFKKKEEPVKEMIELSGTIDRAMTWTYFDSAPILVFTLKEYNKTFYLKYVWPKQALTKENDSVTFKVEQGMPTDKNHVDEMVEVEYTSFRNKNLSF